jgi:hypothetical protein
MRQDVFVGNVSLALPIALGRGLDYPGALTLFARVDRGASSEHERFNLLAGGTLAALAVASRAHDLFSHNLTFPLKLGAGAPVHFRLDGL